MDQMEVRYLRMSSEEIGLAVTDSTEVAEEAEAPFSELLSLLDEPTDESLLLPGPETGFSVLGVIGVFGSAFTASVPLVIGAWLAATFIEATLPSSA